MRVTETVDLLYLSPHLDDAALSCGGQIYQATQAGKSVWIVTVMAGDPPAMTAHATSALVDELHQRWQLAEDAVAARREEDLAACAILGATAHHLSVPDCVYRGEDGQFFYKENPEIFGAIHPQEATLVLRLAEDFCSLPQTQQVFVPLGVGHHVDHLLVRAAAEAAWSVARLTYYEEYPYAEKPGARELALTHAPDPPDHVWEPECVRLAEDALAARIRAIGAYRSQLSTFFKDEQELAQRVESYVAACGGERLWHRGEGRDAHTQ